MSRRSGATISAAADGVGARRSATKSADREVGLVADGGDDGASAEDGARDELLVERPQLLRRSRRRARR